MKKIIEFLKKRDLYHILTRYGIAAIMLRYSIMKIYGMQFVTVPPFSSFGQSLEHLSGYQLTWSFLGYSHKFQVILGLLEFIPACMLLFRRTAFAGAILMLPMTLSVCMINYSMDLWGSTKIISAILLVLNMLLFFFERERVARIFQIVAGRVKNKYLLLEIVIAVLLVGSAVAKKVFNTTYHTDIHNVLTGEWFAKSSNEFIIISECVNDSTIPHHSVRAYFDPWSGYGELNDSVNNGDGFKYYEIDTQKHLLSITNEPYQRSDMPPYHYFLAGDYKYELKGDSLMLQEAVDDSTTHYLLFRKRELDVTRHY